ncbi:hypothetical protein ACWGID_27030 [Kribbella sp. NPDC054772]
MRSKIISGTGAVAGLALAAGTALTIAAPADAASCSASSGHLYCANKANTPIYLNARYENPKGAPEKIVDTLQSSYSYFKCYVRGTSHGGGNNVWYKTYGDKNGRWGYVPALNVYTPKDPYPGVSKC